MASFVRIKEEEEGISCLNSRYGLVLMEELKNFEKEKKGGRLGLKRNVTCWFAAVNLAENDILSNPIINNYNLAPKNEGMGV